MKSATKAFIIVGMIFGWYLIFPVVLGAIALKNLKSATNASELKLWGALCLVFVNVVAGVLLLCMTDEDLGNKKSNFPNDSGCRNNDTSNDSDKSFCRGNNDSSSYPDNSGDNEYVCKGDGSVCKDAFNPGDNANCIDETDDYLIDEELLED